MMLRARTLTLFILIVVLGLSIALVGCSSGDDTQASDQTTQDQQSSGESAAPDQGGDQLYTPAYKPTGKETATMKTSKGTIEIKLFGKDAPIHVANFVELAQKGFYNNTKFHRYEPGFVIQGGDPQTKEMTSDQVAAAVADGSVPLGTGGPGYVIKGEFDPSVNPNKHTRGALGMARTMDPDTAGSQFYFALQPLPQLDGQYTVYGQITKGLDVMDQLRVGDEIISVTINNAN